ncbi:MAG: type II secretion system F family protein [Methylotenera sp.]|nr:type II secretion system F family protein [Oligoflexia bacterium]
MIMTAYALVGLGAFILARMLLQEQESRAAQDNLAELRDRKASNGLVKLTRPFFTQYVVPLIRGKPFWDNQRLNYRRKIITAGLKEELTSDEFIAFKLFLIIFFPVVGMFLRATGFLDVEWYYMVGFGLAGWFYPDYWASTLIKGRQKSILRAMPFIVDLLALSTEAGLDFVGAIGKVVDKAKPSPLVEEFGQMLKEIKVGSSRGEALREMAFRINMTEVNSFVAILISADQMGASIGKILRQQSEQIRVERMLRAEKAGAAAASKVLIPLVFFILPAVMLMVFGPFVLGMIYPNGT